MQLSINVSDIDLLVRGYKLPEGVEYQGTRINPFGEVEVSLKAEKKILFKSFKVDVLVALKLLGTSVSGLKIQLTKANIVGISAKDLVTSLLEQLPEVTPFMDDYNKVEGVYTIALPAGITLSGVVVSPTTQSINLQLVLNTAKLMETFSAKK